MILTWLDGREATEIGAALADEFAPRTESAATRGSPQGSTSGSMAQLLRRADREVRPLQLNFYKKAKFANSFKWRLIENGVKPEAANEVTESLLVHLSQNMTDTASGRTSGAVPADQSAAGKKVADLLARAHKSFAERNYEDAVALYSEFVELRPRRSDVLNNLGVALSNLGRYREAEQRYRQAIEIDPEFAEALCNLANLLQGDPQEAEIWLRRALKVNPKYPGARTKLGVTLAFTGRLHEAKASFRKGLKNDPRDSDAMLGLAQIARTEGRFEESESLTRRALQVHPKLPTAWAALNSTRKMTSADSAWLKGAEEIAGGGVSLWEEAELRFAIGKYYDDVEDFDRAFQNFRRANELLKSVAGKYDRQSHSDFADDMIRRYTRETMAVTGAGASASTKPVIVVGMPRSGTSLAEQIIASHPNAKGVGEPDFWLKAARVHQAELRQGIVSESLRKKLAAEYLGIIERHCPDASRIVDKTPINSDFVGFIHSVFPNARIIRMRRNAIDTCLSCYFQHFSTAMRFTMDLSDLADYYKVHQRLMNHWVSALSSNAILEVPYEGLVTEQEAWTRKILDFLGLDWDDRCLAFHETKRSVNTASAWQVRQKMYKQSVERWRNYEKFIGPLKGLRE